MYGQANRGVVHKSKSSEASVYNVGRLGIRRRRSSGFAGDGLLATVSAGDLVLEIPSTVLQAVLGPNGSAVRSELHLAAVPVHDRRIISS